ncbi:MAG: prepilin-type N-terminal cleavage/methylation domain-containing protein [Bdellovibrionales bacterium]|nr:prepilin-type N-terminal cleavage/methylation domain-containing protein [Bdellovibrionales bacterium]
MRPLNNTRGPLNKSGFTFIEVLVAMLIFVLAALTAVELVKGAVKSTGRTKEITEATWLLQNIMTELETKIETLGFEDGCEKKTEARFSAPYENYSWIATCEEIEFRLSETAAKAMAAKAAGEEDYDTREDQVLKLVLNVASDYMTNSTRELHASVKWMEGTTPRSISATTQVITLDQKLPSLGLGGGGSSSSESGSGSGGSTP